MDADNGLLSEIEDMNLTYLMLAQRLLKEDFAKALLRLKIDDERGELMLSLPAKQMRKLARTNQLMLQLCTDSGENLRRSADGDDDQGMAQMRTALLMAGAKPACEPRSSNGDESKKKSLIQEMHQVQLAIELIELGARLQVLETETELSRGRLIRLYKEVRGISPPKGMLPFSTTWFITWLPNIHASLFYNYYRRFAGCERIEALVNAYEMYLEQLHLNGAEPVLGFTRAWTLVRFFESDMFELAECGNCSGNFLVHAYTPTQDFVCGICRPPPRAGKTNKARPVAPVVELANLAVAG